MAARVPGARTGAGVAAGVLVTAGAGVRGAVGAGDAAETRPAAMRSSRAAPAIGTASVFMSWYLDAVAPVAG